MYRSRARKKSSESSPNLTTGVYAGTGEMYQCLPSRLYAWPPRLVQYKPASWVQ